MPGNRKILVLDSFWRKALAVVRALGEKGLKVTCGESRILSGAFFSRFCQKRIVYPSPKTRSEAFITTLISVLKKDAYDCVYPLEDETIEVILETRALVERWTRLPLPPRETFRKARNKKETFILAQRLKIPCPKTLIIEDGKDFQEKLSEVRYPAVLKPQESGGARGVKYITQEAELLKAYYELQPYYSSFLLQELIPPGGKAVGVSALYDKRSQPVAVFVHRRLREYPIRGGASTLRESIRDERVKEMALTILTNLKWYGVAMVEFKYDPRDNQPKLLEINPRFWGSLELAIKAGVNFPYLLYKVVMDEEIEPVMKYKLGVRCRWLLPGDLCHFLANPKRFSLQPSFFKFYGTAYDILSWRDPLPVLGTLLSGLEFVYNSELKNFLRR